MSLVLTIATTLILTSAAIVYLTSNETASKGLGGIFLTGLFYFVPIFTSWFLYSQIGGAK